MICLSLFLTEQLNCKKQPTNQTVLATKTERELIEMQRKFQLAKIALQELEQTAMQLSLLRKELPATLKKLSVYEKEISKEIAFRQERSLSTSEFTMPDTVTILTRV